MLRKPTENGKWPNVYPGPVSWKHVVADSTSAKFWHWWFPCKLSTFVNAASGHGVMASHPKQLMPAERYWMVNTLINGRYIPAAKKPTALKESNLSGTGWSPVYEYGNARSSALKGCNSIPECSKVSNKNTIPPFQGGEISCPCIHTMGFTHRWHMGAFQALSVVVIVNLPLTVLLTMLFTFFPGNGLIIE